MFVRESPDDQCTIVNIVASDCTCSDVFISPLCGFFVLSKSATSATEAVQDHGESFVFMPKFQETFPKNNCNSLVIEREKQQRL